MTGLLSGQRIVVCGGGSGIGFAAARHLSRMGAEMTITGRSETKLEAAAARIEGPVDIASVDYADAAACVNFFERCGHPDHVVVSLAGNASLGPFADIGESDFRMTFEGKFWPCLNAIHAAANVLSARGSISIVTGASALAAAPGASSLSAVNGALEGMIKTLAVEVAPRRINAASPGLTDTEAWDRIPDTVRGRMYEEAAAKTPLGRIGSADDAAQLVAAFITNDFLTGLVVPCDGGRRLV